jgi:hypothetical protein
MTPGLNLLKRLALFGGGGNNDAMFLIVFWKKGCVN